MRLHRIDEPGGAFWTPRRCRIEVKAFANAAAIASKIAIYSVIHRVPLTTLHQSPIDPVTSPVRGARWCQIVRIAIHLGTHLFNDANH